MPIVSCRQCGQYDAMSPPEPVNWICPECFRETARSPHSMSNYWEWAKRRYDPWYQYWASMKPIPFVVDPNCPKDLLQPGTNENPWWHSRLPLVIDASIPSDRMYFFGFDGIHTAKL